MKLFRKNREHKQPNVESLSEDEIAELNKKDVLFIDEKPSKFDESVKKSPQNKNVSGNTRLFQGMYRTDKENEKYINDSLERELP